MKIGIIQTDPTVGDLEGNAALIAAAARRMAGAGADLIVSPELSLLGYPCRDLLLLPGFVNQGLAAADELAAELADLPPVLIGLVRPNPSGEGRPLQNTVALLSGGRVERFFAKTLLPTYDVFDEDRYFEPASADDPPAVAEVAGVRVGITICEDIWNDKEFWNRRRYRTDPVESLVREGAEVVVNLSASPFSVGKHARREEMMAASARRHARPVVFVNQVGGNDDLVFDGRSCLFGADGRLLARAEGFAQDALTVELDAPGRVAEDNFGPESEIWRALVLGISDYAAKCGFKGALLGLSGGIDSALTAALAADALGQERVLGVLMPSPYSSAGSVDDSLALAANLGIATHTLPIAGLMDGFQAALAQPFQGLEPDLTEENIQARIRGNLLMSLSNKFGRLLLTTGNKSEVAVGYCTLYGDMAGGLAAIADVPKTMVYRVCRWLNETRGREIIPEAVLTKPPSAELRPDQRDDDSLPPYDVLDAILEHHIEGHLTAGDLIDKGYDPATVDRVVNLVRIAEFKRRQAAPGLKVTDRAFGSGWRMPIARK